MNGDVGLSYSVISIVARDWRESFVSALQK
jgi:hypothetical protein